MESYGGIILKGKNRITREKTFASTIFSTTNLTWTDLGANPALRGKRPEITEVWLGEESRS
jgi:hypothetical protein